jgi:hypothetical protein
LPSLLCLQQCSVATASNSGDSSASCAHVITVCWISHNSTLVSCQLNYSAISSQPSIQGSYQLPTLNWTLSLTNHLLNFTSINWTTTQPSPSPSHLMTGGLPPISSSSRQALWDSLPGIFFQLIPSNHSPYVTLSLTRKWVYLLRIAWSLVKCTYCTYGTLLNILPFVLYTSPLSVQALQNRSCLSYPVGLGSSLYSLRADPTENTASNSSSIIVIGSCLAIEWISFLQEHVYWPLPSNACSFLRSLHSNDVTWYNIYIPQRGFREIPHVPG